MFQYFWDLLNKPSMYRTPLDELAFMFLIIAVIMLIVSSGLLVSYLRDLWNRQDKHK